MLVSAATAAAAAVAAVKVSLADFEVVTGVTGGQCDFLAVLLWIVTGQITSLRDCKCVTGEQIGF